MSLIIELLTQIKADESTGDSQAFYSGMVPNYRFNVTMAVIFGLLLLFQFVVGLYTRQYWFFAAFTCACILEMLGYIGRALSHKDLTVEDYFLLQFICLTIAPVFTMGGIYYQLAKLIEIYGHKFALLPTPMMYSYIFIICDIVSLVIQAIGGGAAGSAVTENKSTATGTHIFVAGLAFQVASMSVFLVMWFHLLYKIYISTRKKHANVTKFSWSLLKIPQCELDYQYRQSFSDLRLNPQRWTFHYFSLGLTASVIFVYIRCIYRVIELAEGWSGYLITHEWYFIILDALMMSLATLILSFFHPGFSFRGRYVKIPITKAGKEKEADCIDSASSSEDPLTEDSEGKNEQNQQQQQQNLNA